MYVPPKKKVDKKKLYMKIMVFYLNHNMLVLFNCLTCFFCASRHFHERKRAQMRRVSQMYVCQELLGFFFLYLFFVFVFFVCVWCISPSLSHTRVYRNVTIASKVLQFFMYIVDSWLIYCAVGHDLTYSYGKCFSAWKNS